MISRQEVEHVARLARLHFEEDELARLQPELAQIIDYVQQLAELDLSGPGAHLACGGSQERAASRRAASAGLEPGRGVANGPDVERGQFVVPRIG